MFPFALRRPTPLARSASPCPAVPVFMSLWSIESCHGGPSASYHFIYVHPCISLTPPPLPYWALPFRNVFSPDIQFFSSSVPSRGFVSELLCSLWAGIRYSVRSPSPFLPPLHQITQSSLVFSSLKHSLFALSIYPTTLSLTPCPPHLPRIFQLFLMHLFFPNPLC